MLSQTAEYALRAVLHLAEHDEGPVRAGDMARALGIPPNYLSKTMNALVRAGVLTSGRGPAGGFRLARAADKVPLQEVVAPFDAVVHGRQCLLGRPTCTDRNPCAAHESWKKTSDAVNDFFRTTTVADLRKSSAAPSSSAR